VRGERKFKILQALINDYIATAEPVGSRTLAKKAGLGISAATIRNEMGDLTDMGLVLQPHTSAGRVPSYLAYRLYVDSMMPQAQLSAEVAMALQRVFIGSMSRADRLVRDMASALTDLTGYPAIVSEPARNTAKIKHIALIPVDEKQILLVLVGDTNTIQTQTVAVDAAPGADDLHSLSGLINRQLSGKTAGDISRDTIEHLLSRFGRHAHIVMPTLGILAGMAKQPDDARIFISGARNLLRFPEFADSAPVLLSALDDTAQLSAILGHSRAAPGSIEVKIGEENDISFLKNCSLVRAAYTIDGRATGRMAIIGPTRMDYVSAVTAISGVLQNIASVAEALQNN
jgi:heat-inducible transcriptional repressor